MFSPQRHAEGFEILRDEQLDLFLRQDCHERMAATLNYLREMVAHAPLPEGERQTLLSQLSHILHHLKESVDVLAAEALGRHN